MSWGSRLVSGALCLALSVSSGACLDWLEVDDEGDNELALEARRALRAEAPPLPSRPPEPEGDGPIVPRSAGLRVPADAGYWVRVRLETLDVILPFAVASFTRVDGTLFVRLEGTQADSPDARAFRGVIGVKLPYSADIGDISGADLKPELADTTAVFHTSGKDTWVLEPRRLTFELITPEVVVGSVQGVATRGMDGRRQRSFELGFVALRGPDATLSATPPDRDPLTP